MLRFEKPSVEIVIRHLVTQIIWYLDCETIFFSQLPGWLILMLLWPASDYIYRNFFIVLNNVSYSTF